MKEEFYVWKAKIWVQTSTVKQVEQVVALQASCAGNSVFHVQVMGFYLLGLLWWRNFYLPLRELIYRAAFFGGGEGEWTLFTHFVAFQYIHMIHKAK